MSATEVYSKRYNTSDHVFLFTNTGIIQGHVTPHLDNMIYSESYNSSQIDNDTESSTHTHWSVIEKVIFGTWLSISMVLAILGNLMVIAVVWRHRGMRTRTNMFLVNLAVADFLVGILMAPFSLTTLIAHDWILGDVLCFVNSFLTAACFITSIHTLMCISIHKYLSIIRPLSRITKCKIMVMIVCVWTWGIICASLTTFILSKATYKRGTMQCGPKYPEISTKSLIFHFIIQTSNIFLPLIIMCFAYFRMFREIKQHMQRLDENTAMDRQQIYGQQRRVTITLFIVLACFVLCWIPYCVYANYATFIKNKDEIPRFPNALAYCFGYMNSACNPIIYAWRSPSFREGYKEILCQEPSYVVSDDTIHDSSPSPRRKLSAFISSIRGSRTNSRRGSEESFTGHHVARTARDSQSSNTSTHKLLRKLTSRTSTLGTSIIKRDGSVIMVKNGKIVSMREDLSSKKKKKDMFDDVFLPDSEKSQTLPLTKSSRNNQSNLKVLYENTKENIEVEPFLRNGDTAKNSGFPKKLQKENPKVKNNNSNIDIPVSAYDIEKMKTFQTKSCDYCLNKEDIRRQNGHCQHVNNDFSLKRSKSDIIAPQFEMEKQNFSKSAQEMFTLPILNGNSSSDVSQFKVDNSGNHLNVQNQVIKSSSSTHLIPGSHDCHVTYKRRWTQNKEDKGTKL